MIDFGPLLTPELGLAAAIALLAGLVRGFVGFGSGLLMAPSFALLFGPSQTVAIIIMMEIVVTLQVLPKAWKDVEWRFVGTMALAAAVGMPAGTWLILHVDPATMTRAISGVVILSVAVIGAGWRYGGPKKPLITVAVGLISGTMLTSTSLANPPVIIYQMAGAGAAAATRANIIAYFPATQAVAVPMMFLSGVADWTAAVRALLLLVPFAFGTAIGTRFFAPEKEQLFRRVVLGVLLIAGVAGLVG
ncbi:MAG: sulfite exporter TauE/SafE family protein [Proteobacteria bacterium]|nr:sulfite exporter TauE/SafE family protein [Pseudomonadota bacterium]